MKRKKCYYSTGYSYFNLVTHPSTHPAEQDLTLLSGRNMLLSLWYSDSMLDTFFYIFKIRKGNKKRKKSVILAGKIQNKNISKRNMKMRIISCLSLSDEDKLGLIDR